MTPFNQWVSENNVDSIIPKKNYSKGWWDYIEFIRELHSTFNVECKDVHVMDKYVIGTPPPEETLVLPLIHFEINGVKLYLKQDFSCGGFYDTWIVSINLNEKTLDFNLKKYINNVELDKKEINPVFIDAFIKPFVINKIMFNNYKKGLNKFTGTLNSDLDLYCFLKILNLELI